MPFSHLANAAPIRHGRERLPPETHRPRHGRRDAYLTVIIAGAFEQTGYGGRFRLEAGDIMVQPTLDRHADRMISRGIDILRLPWSFDLTAGGVWRGGDIDALCRLAERDVTAAGEAAKAQLQAAVQLTPVAPILDHWADALMADIIAAPAVRLADWARRRGLAREAVSRAFHRLYGVTAAGIRQELRMRAAWADCMYAAEPLAEVALNHGFSDQPHMTRTMQALTGASPSQWRTRSQNFKTAP